MMQSVKDNCTHNQFSMITNRVEAATPPSAPLPARVRRKAENTLRGPCHIKTRADLFLICPGFPSAFKTGLYLF